MTKLVARFVKDESGATAIEYGLIAAGIALAIITAVNSVGTALSGKFTTIKNSLDKVITGEGGVKTEDERVVQAYHLVNNALEALVTMRETKATLEKAAALGLTLAPPAPIEGAVEGTVEEMLEAAE